MNLEILFRSCSRVHSVHGGVRLLGASKMEVALHSLNSILHSVHHAMGKTMVSGFNVTVIDDHSDPIVIEKIQHLLKKSRVQTKLIPLETTGNAASLKETFEYAKRNSTGLIYFVEDDYIHCRPAIQEMIEAYYNLRQTLNREVIIHPCDYPDRYRDPYPSYITLSEHRYWRSILQTTGTFMLHETTLKKYWHHYIKLAEYGVTPGVTEDNTINLIYREVPCFSPMPSLAIHWQSADQIPPFVDWMSWWKENAVFRDEPLNHSPRL